MTTMFDFAEYYDRIANIVPNNCVCAEIGVADGDSIIFLAKSLASRGKSFKLYGVDNMEYGSLFQMRELYQNMIKNSVASDIEIIPKDSVTAAKDFNDGFFDFIFLDTSHQYQETKDSIKSWYSKLKDGGILAGHDYHLYSDGVGKAVDELIPQRIKRETINTPEQYQEFEEEDFLTIYNTQKGYGIWECKKDFYKKLNY